MLFCILNQNHTCKYFVLMCFSREALAARIGFQSVFFSATHNVKSRETEVHQSSWAESVLLLAEINCLPPWLHSGMSAECDDSMLESCVTSVQRYWRLSGTTATHADTYVVEPKIRSNPFKKTVRTQTNWIPLLDIDKHSRRLVTGLVITSNSLSTLNILNL